MDKNRNFLINKKLLWCKRQKTVWNVCVFAVILTRRVFAMCAGRTRRSTLSNRSKAPVSPCPPAERSRWVQHLNLTITNTTKHLKVLLRATGRSSRGFLQTDQCSVSCSVLFCGNLHKRHSELRMQTHHSSGGNSSSSESDFLEDGFSKRKRIGSSRILVPSTLSQNIHNITARILHFSWIWFS